MQGRDHLEFVCRLREQMASRRHLLEALPQALRDAGYCLEVGLGKSVSNLHACAHNWHGACMHTETGGLLVHWQIALHQTVCS